MAKYKEKIEARKMRIGGISIDKIALKLKVSKSSVSLWCRNILLTPEQIEIQQLKQQEAEREILKKASAFFAQEMR